MSSGVDGLCGGCLLRIATIDPTQSSTDPFPAASFEEWLLLKGQRIAGYELLDEIARGGMGIVYRARQVAAGRNVAICRECSSASGTKWKPSRSSTMPESCRCTKWASTWGCRTSA
jgi:hypothetical protein